MGLEPELRQRTTSPEPEKNGGDSVALPMMSRRSADVNKVLQPRKLDGHTDPNDLRKLPGHPSHELHLHIAGHGSVSAELVVTVERGQPGIPLTDGELKVLKTTVSEEVGHLLPKIEFAVANDELTLDTPWNGLSFRLEASALNATLHGC